MSTVQETGFDDEVEDEIYVIAERTNDDGTVAVKIDDVEKIDNQNDDFLSDKVEVDIVTPTGDIVTKEMDWPEQATAEYEFVRLCRAVGLSFTAASQLPGAEIRARPNDDYELVIPDADTVEPTPLSERLRDRAPEATVTVTYVTFTLALASALWTLFAGEMRDVSGMVFIASFAVLTTTHVLLFLNDPQ